MTDIEPRTLRELLSYDSLTGSLTWLERPLASFPLEHAGRAWNTRYANRPAFARFDREGYYKGTLLKRTLQGHRVAWAMHYGEWPNGQIDHINGDRTDNRICNLRIVDHSQNGRNAKRSRANSSGATGVHRIRGRWRAAICVDRHHKSLGLFDNFAAAVAARKAAEAEFGFHANHGRG